MTKKTHICWYCDNEAIGWCVLLETDEDSGRPIRETQNLCLDCVGPGLTVTDWSGNKSVPNPVKISRKRWEASGTDAPYPGPEWIHYKEED